MLQRVAACCSALQRVAVRDHLFCFRSTPFVTYPPKNGEIEAQLLSVGAARYACAHTNTHTHTLTHTHTHSHTHTHTHTQTPHNTHTHTHRHTHTHTPKSSLSLSHTHRHLCFPRACLKFHPEQKVKNMKRHETTTLFDTVQISSFCFCVFEKKYDLKLSDSKTLYSIRCLLTEVVHGLVLLIFAFELPKQM